MAPQNKEALEGMQPLLNQEMLMLQRLTYNSYWYDPKHIKALKN